MSRGSLESSLISDKEVLASLSETDQTALEFVSFINKEEHENLEYVSVSKDDLLQLAQNFLFLHMHCVNWKFINPVGQMKAHAQKIH